MMRDRFTNEYIAMTAGAMLIVAGIMAITIRDSKPYILGWIFGCLISMAMFKLMFFTLTRAVEKTEKDATTFTRIHYFLRFLLYAVVLVVAAKAEYLSLATTFFGLLAVKNVILMRNLFDYLRRKKGGGF
ncbi:MAG: ATP synthase subunit I [Peptoniphilus sp.]|nr:ATP synthase subunit I [Peptoniphilus sp.]MDD7363216.1 ATP synthase subunit I [Bacillota bacterium]MDY6044460.1 ATP synthase subunit I [Peptoniphilus sp.]